MTGWTWDYPWEEKVSVRESAYAEPLPVEGKKEHPEFVLDEKTGLLLPEGARKTKHQPGFGSDWE